jgi:hypothetical protein
MEQTKQDLRRIARTLSGKAHDELMRLGEVLLAISAGRFYYNWGWNTWAEYTENEVGLYPGATYELMAIARWCGYHRFTKKQRSQVARLGRCKAALIARMSPGKQSADWWVAWAKDHTVAELRAQVYGESAKTAPKTVAFWMYGRQRKVLARAMKRAKREIGDDYHGELLYTICQGYLAKAKAVA